MEATIKKNVPTESRLALRNKHIYSSFLSVFYLFFYFNTREI